MKMPSRETIQDLCTQIDIDAAGLILLGGGNADNDGVVYRSGWKGAPVALKIVSYEKTAMASITELDSRMRFARYLSDNGVSLSAPLPLGENTLYVSCFEDDTLYAAYLMPLLPGGHPVAAEQTPQLMRAWGDLTGRIHALTQEFPLWQSMTPGAQTFDYIREYDLFYGWAKDPVLRTHWEQMRRELDALPKERAAYGYIHNDNHERNILWDGSSISLIDFDCACCQFFMHDIVTPLQGLLFDFGGMCGPVRDEERLKGAYEAFLEGHERRYHLDAGWLKRANLFVQYRRLLLGTLLQGLMKQNAAIRDGFYQMLDAPGVLPE